MFFREIGVKRGVWAIFLFGVVFTSPLMADGKGVDPLLARVYQEQRTPDVSAWWVSEKLDGVRAIWDGEVLRFRSGRVIAAPKWFTEPFSQQPMDGELWMGRGTFDQTSAAVRRKVPRDVEWQQIQYRLFELPDAAGSFTQRIEQMERLTDQLNTAWLQPVDQRRLDTREALFRWLDRVVAQGGEGLMLHRAEALYHGGRSGDLLKLKSWQDAEAVVVGILPGKGKYQGVMGALLVESAEGRRFRIGTGFSDAVRSAPPAIGSQITYKYTGTTRTGLPQFPVFLRQRQRF